MLHQTFCCSNFAKQAGEIASRSPAALAYGEPSKAQFQHLPEGDWAIEGCCGGNCYVVVGIKFCPYCATALN